MVGGPGDAFGGNVPWTAIVAPGSGIHAVSGLHSGAHPKPPRHAGAHHDIDYVHMH